MVVRDREEQEEYRDYVDSIPTDFLNGQETYTDYLRIED